MYTCKASARPTVTPGLGRLRQLEASLGYTARPLPKKKKKVEREGEEERREEEGGERRGGRGRKERG